MPTIRSVRPTDLVSLISFLRDGSHREVTAPMWPRLSGGTDGRAVRRLLPRVLIGSGRSQVWVSTGRGGLRGVAVAQPRAAKLAWDVEDLFVSEDDHSVGIDLLEHLSGEAARRGARRVFLTTPIESDLARMASRAGFANYTSEVLYSLQLAAPVSGSGASPARPRLRQDTQALFQLYNAAVPCRVRSAEAMTIDEWSSLDRGSRLWAPSLGGITQHLVWEGQAGLIAWLRLTFGAHSQLLELLSHPAHGAEVDAILQYSLSQASHKVPIYAPAREYQADISGALERRGFSRMADYLIFAKELATRVHGRVLVPARA